MFSFRRMSAADKPAMAEIAAQIWEGTDYLPDVFDQWLADKDGEFTAVLFDGRVVGCGKLTFFTPTDAWFEGLRKDPRIEAKGLGDAVARYFLKLLSARRDLTSVRFSTYFSNGASQAIHEKLGFRRRAVLSYKEWAGTQAECAALPLRAPAGTGSGVQVIRDESVVSSLLEEYFTSTQGLVVEGWRVLPYSRPLVAERFIRAGHCRGVVSERGLRGAAIHVVAARPSRVTVKIVCLDAADDASADALFDDIVLSARAAGGSRVEIEWVVPPLERVKRWCARWALRSMEQEDDFLVYELPIEEVRT